MRIEFARVSRMLVHIVLMLVPCMLMGMLVLMFPLFPVLLARQILLPIHPNIHFGSRNAATHDP
jgi:hypothetical protein